jgi:hypothetical protein
LVLRNPYSALTLPNAQPFNTEGVRRFPAEGSPTPSNTSPVLQSASRRVQPSFINQQSSSAFSSQQSSSAFNDRQSGNSFSSQQSRNSFSSQPHGNSVTSQQAGNSVTSQAPGNSITRLAPNFFRFVPPRVASHLDSLQADNSSRLSRGSEPGTSGTQPGLSRQLSHSMSRGAKLVHLALSRANSNETDHQDDSYSSLIYEEVSQEIHTHSLCDGRVVTETATTLIVEDDTQVNYFKLSKLKVVFPFRVSTERDCFFKCCGFRSACIWLS